MLSKDKRLNLKKDFKWVASGSLRGASKQFETKYLKLFIRGGNNQFPKVGIALSSESFRKANKRNRAKRVTSAAFEAIYEKLPENINIVVLPKPSVLDVKSGDVLLDLEEALKQGKVISDKR